MSWGFCCKSISKNLVTVSVRGLSFRQYSSSTPILFQKSTDQSQGILNNHVGFGKKCIYRTFHSTSSSLQTSNENKLNEDLESDKPCIGDGTWKEVYQGILTAQLKLVKLFSLGTSCIGITAQPLLYQKLCDVNFLAFLGVTSFIGFFSFVTPFLIHSISKKYVTKLEYDPTKDMYAATTLTFFLRERKVHFNVNDVIRPEIPGMFSSFKVHGRPLFVDPELFEDVDHYVRIMGFDKPVDLRSHQFKDEKKD